MKDIDVLLATPLLPSLMESLSNTFTVHPLWSQVDSAAFFDRIGPSIRGIVTGTDREVRADLFRKCPKLEIIANFGVGVDNIDVAAARKQGIVVTNTPDVLSDCVADLTMTLLLALSRRVCEADRFVRKGAWPKGKFPLAADVRGRKCGIVGMGSIGTRIASRAEAFGIEILYHSRSQKDLPYRYVKDVVQLAEEVDYLVVAVPGGKETGRLIDESVIKALGPEGYLVNIARGSVVHEEVLIKYLQEGKLAGAALDVFECEPHVPSEFFEMENVILTPHIGSATHETRQAMGDLVFANIKAHFSGQPLLTPVS